MPQARLSICQIGPGGAKIGPGGSGVAYVQGQRICDQHKGLTTTPGYAEIYRSGRQLPYTDLLQRQQPTGSSDGAPWYGTGVDGEV